MRSFILGFWVLGMALSLQTHADDGGLPATRIPIRVFADEVCRYADPTSQHPHCLKKILGSSVYSGRTVIEGTANGCRYAVHFGSKDCFRGMIRYSSLIPADVRQLLLQYLSMATEDVMIRTRCDYAGFGEVASCYLNELYDFVKAVKVLSPHVNLPVIE